MQRNAGGGSRLRSRCIQQPQEDTWNRDRTIPRHRPRAGRGGPWSCDQGPRRTGGILLGSTLNASGPWDQGTLLGKGCKEQVSSRGCSKGVCWGREGRGLARRTPVRRPAPAPTPSSRLQPFPLGLALPSRLLLMPGCPALGTEPSPWSENQVPWGRYSHFLPVQTGSPKTGWERRLARAHAAHGIGGGWPRGAPSAEGVTAKSARRPGLSAPRPPLRGGPFSPPSPLRPRFLPPPHRLRVAAGAVLCWGGVSRAREDPGDPCLPLGVQRGGVQGPTVKPRRSWRGGWRPGPGCGARHAGTLCPS